MDFSFDELGVEASHLFKGHDRSVPAFWTGDDHPLDFGAFHSLEPVAKFHLGPNSPFCNWLLNLRLN
jgi:hypothetical protein